MQVKWPVNNGRVTKRTIERSKLSRNWPNCRITCHLFSNWPLRTAGITLSNWLRSSESRSSAIPPETFILFALPTPGRTSRATTYVRLDPTGIFISPCRHWHIQTILDFHPCAQNVSRFKYKWPLHLFTAIEPLEFSELDILGTLCNTSTGSQFVLKLLGAVPATKILQRALGLHHSSIGSYLTDNHLLPNCWLTKAHQQMHLVA